MTLRLLFLVPSLLAACQAAVAADSAPASAPTLPNITDKTLVAWVAPANLTQRGGSVLTLDDQQSHFDAIVFGELAPARWMAGSDFYRRTKKEQGDCPAETAGPQTVVQVAIVYQGNHVTVYRDGKVYVRHEISQPQAFRMGSAVLLGLRHIEAADGACFAGTIEDARLYDIPLTADQIAALRSRKRSEPRPLAWWTFEDGTARDLMGTFPVGRLVGSARITDGKLVLDGKGSYFITPPDALPPAQQPEAMPTYHFVSPTSLDCMRFEPNGAFCWKGRYHLGYIYQDQGTHCWGHASSDDLLHWKRHPPMLTPNPGDPDQGLFSGNAFVDHKGRVVIHYHGVGAGNCIAVAADDQLNVFKKLAANPVMKDPGWDPHGWLEGDNYYSISGGNPPSLYKAIDEDQTKWKLLGKLMSRDMPEVEKDEDISCPDLFRLGDKRVLLCISHKRGARYYVGRFENEQFHPERHERMNWPGGACFAPETLLDAKGRRVMWAWAIGSPSSMTLPRILSMGKDGALRIEPAPELEALRRNPRRLDNQLVKADSESVLERVNGDALELRVRIDPKHATRCGLKVRRSPDGGEETVIEYHPAKKSLRIDLAKSSLSRGVRYKTYVMTGADNPDVTAQKAPFELKPGEPLELRVFLDKTMLEVFANGRQCLTQRIYPTRPDSQGIALFSVNGDARFQSVEPLDMAPTKFE
jgi:beta-fructofuranosidase